MPAVRVVALIASHDEELFIGGCIEHLHSQGVDTYLIDDGSTDRTVEIAERCWGRGLIGLERRPWDGVYRLRSLLERKEELAATLDADWFLHHDTDEIRLSPHPSITLAEVLAEVDRQGFNAVNFMEFTFLPTRESPDHDHPRFRDTMRWYYPFSRGDTDQVKAWKRQPRRVHLAESGGHLVDFPGRAVCPVRFPMRHYQFLSPAHAVRKYVRRIHDPRALAMGWHGGRATLRPEDVVLPGRDQLRECINDHHLDPSDPRRTHWLFDQEVRVIEAAG
ncbi:MAG: glycosyltransferase family 2 protein [Actinomycetota bacterium]